MSRRPPVDLIARARVLLAAALALALGSCGRQPLATAPRAGATPASIEYTHTDLLNEVAVLPAAGVNVHQLADDYGATIAAGSNYVCIRFVPPTGTSPEVLAGELMADPRVIAAERNAVLETAEARQESYASDDGNGSLESATEQPALRAIGIESAHDVSSGAGVRVAVLDTGVDPNHPLLASRIAGGYDYVAYDPDPTDDADGIDDDGDGQIDEAWGHGTHVAGLVALTAPEAKLLIVRVLNADGRGDIASVTAGIRWAIDHGANVLNLSLGMLQPSLCIERLLTAAEQAGLVVVCSAGNWGAENPQEYPAISPHAIAVAATDADAHPAIFTSYGDFVAIGAPGVAVRSAYPGGGWRLWSGTSMSTPLVSGTAALLLAVHPDWGREQVLERLSAHAQGLLGTTPDQFGKLGIGMLKAGDALRPDFLGQPPAPVDPAPVLHRP